MKEARWQDWTNVLFGAWLILAPFIGIGVSGDVAAINSYVIGVLVVLFAFAAISHTDLWKEYSNLVLGLWLIIAPFVLSFTALVGPTYNQILMGLLISGVALAAILQKTPKSGGESHGHHGHA